jgi:L,D-peptidoglycan transpeptidase YkuD (ErfK/YbiS/YcfS/YnhG family)
MSRKNLLSVFLCAVAFTAAQADVLDARVRQLVVSIAPDWNSMTGKIQRFERGADGMWQPVSKPVPVLYGKNGLAWGRGVKGQDEQGLKKVERDKRAPAGIFEIGKVYTYDAKLPDGSDYPFHQVTDADVWSDDPRSPDYNRHVVIDPKNPPDNFSHERMRPGDFAYHWIIEIKHNENPAVPGAGSAIFFHTRRGVMHPTSGCTTMAKENLIEFIRWLRAPKHPHYVLLPWGEYRQKWQAWGLPSPEAVSGIAPGK